MWLTCAIVMAVILVVASGVMCRKTQSRHAATIATVTSGAVGFGVGALLGSWSDDWVHALVLVAFTSLILVLFMLQGARRQ